MSTEQVNFSVPDASKEEVISQEEQSRPEWYNRTCSTIDKKTPLSGSKLSLQTMHAVLTNAIRMWDVGQTITCCFVPPAGTSIQQEKVKAVLKGWEEFVNLEFKFVQGKTADIRIAFNERDGSWSYVGLDIMSIPKNQTTMNLGWISKKPETTEDDIGVILHEFGHSMGLLHEHQSPRRGDVITLDEPAVIEFYTRTQGWTEEDVRQQILNVYNVQDVSNFSKMDLKSIMMYFMPAAMNVENIEVKPNNKLSNMDKAFMTINYPYPRKEKKEKFPDSKWTMEFALDTAGVDAETKAKIVEEYEQADYEEVRALFTRWIINVRAARIKAELATARASAATSL